MNPYVIIMLLALFGFCETVYLIICRLTYNDPVCIATGSCKKVLTSIYSRMFGVPNDVIGMFYYATVTLVAAMYYFYIGSSLLAHMILGVMLVCGAMMSLALTFIQGRLLHAWCMWCIFSAITNWSMLIVYFVYTR